MCNSQSKGGREGRLEYKGVGGIQPGLLLWGEGVQEAVVGVELVSHHQEGGRLEAEVVGDRVDSGRLHIHRPVAAIPPLLHHRPALGKDRTPRQVEGV